MSNSLPISVRFPRQYPTQSFFQLFEYCVWWRLPSILNPCDCSFTTLEKPPKSTTTNFNNNITRAGSALTHANGDCPFWCDPSPVPCAQRDNGIKFIAGCCWGLINRMCKIKKRGEKLPWQRVTSGHKEPGRSNSSRWNLSRTRTFFFLRK